MRRTGAERAKLPFRAVNRAEDDGHDPGLQRHHLLPRQLAGRACFARMFAALDADRVGFDDFRRNGLLLPAHSASARRLGLPLHRSPHQHYNALVIERAGQIEAHWALRRARLPEEAGVEALFRLALLQRTLRRRLLDPRGARVVLNASQPLGTGLDFSELDAMADALWAGTHTVLADSSSFAD